MVVGGDLLSGKYPLLMIFHMFAGLLLNGKTHGHVFLCHFAISHKVWSCKVINKSLFGDNVLATVTTNNKCDSSEMKSFIL